MLDSNIVTRGEALILPNPDPAIVIKPGYRRFLVGLDIAQSIDQNAFAIILDERVPFYDENGRQELTPRRREIVRAERVPQMSYTQLAIVTRNLMLDASISGRAHLVVDAGGPGRAFCDLLNTKNVQHTRMQIVGGENEGETRERGTTFNNVGKNRLLSTVNSAMHVGDLKIGNFPMRDDLRVELESFDTSITEAGRMRIEGGTAFGHADIAMAAAMAYWLSDHRTVGAHIGETRLRGFW